MPEHRAVAPPGGPQGYRCGAGWPYKLPTNPNNRACAIGTHLTPTQLAQLGENPDRCVYIAFDQDENQAGQNAAHSLLQMLDKAGLTIRLVGLPAGYDPNSYFLAGASAEDFAHLLEEAPSL